MYAQCGALVKAKHVLEQLPMWSVITWNALIAGTIRKGNFEQALNFFKQMQCEGLSPNATTFSCMLSTCSRLGLVKDAQMLCFDGSYLCSCWNEKGGRRY
ncbi:hypothetical protein GOP47_0025182 [Adiantum capillus-veneris]|uniref:Pentatricopeptide repeat-containing protein n=1 Tax=Adiantum capillus-veneris TaxID=13818 RepID=A0A9D4U476_ADICA|nr:hypothetical protein GOP47_0025182 [Adiantum capillus-veneris]